MGIGIGKSRRRASLPHEAYLAGLHTGNELRGPGSGHRRGVIAVSLEDKRVLVTGGAGFIGTAMARAHAPSSRSWTVVDNLLPQVHGSIPNVEQVVGVEYLRTDVRDARSLAAVVSRVQPQVVFHLAAETGTGQSLDMPSMHTDVNVTGTARLLEALECHLPERLLLTSSRAIYGEGAWVNSQGVRTHPGARSLQMLEAGLWDFPGCTALPSVAGESIPDPSNIYGATKMAQEHLLTSWAAARGVPYSILRLQNVYGPGQSPINPYTGITTLFVRLAARGEAIPVYEDGKIVRDFVFIEDVVTALVASVSGDGNLLADVGSGEARSIREMGEIIAGIVGAPRPKVTGQYRLGDVRHASCDMTTSAHLFGGKPPIALEDGLSRLVTWLREVRHAD